MSDLEAVTTDELVAELARRCEAVVVAWTAEDRDTLHLHTDGSLTARVGLARRLVTFLDHEDVHTRVTREPDDEPEDAG